MISFAPSWSSRVRAAYSRRWTWPKIISRRLVRPQISGASTANRLAMAPRSHSPVLNCWWLAMVAAGPGVHALELRYVGTRALWVALAVSALTALGCLAVGLRRIVGERTAAERGS